MIQHCIASIRKIYEEKGYKAYITDALKTIIEVYHAAHGVEITLPRYTEEPKEEEPTETADEIIQRITEGLTHIGK